MLVLFLFYSYGFYEQLFRTGSNKISAPHGMKNYDGAQFFEFQKSFQGGSLSRDAGGLDGGGLAGCPDFVEWCESRRILEK